MLGTSPGDQVIVEQTATASAVVRGPRTDNKLCCTIGHQFLSATHGKIHIKDKNLIRLENVPEQINGGNSIGPLMPRAEAER
jgi:hypothetical protein